MYFFIAEVERPIHFFRILFYLKYYLIKIKESGWLNGNWSRYVGAEPQIY